MREKLAKVKILLLEIDNISPLRPAAKVEKAQQAVNESVNLIELLINEIEVMKIGIK